MECCDLETKPKRINLVNVPTYMYLRIGICILQFLLHSCSYQGTKISSLIATRVQ